jgi:hypothetical protein
VSEWTKEPWALDGTKRANIGLGGHVFSADVLVAACRGNTALTPEESCANAARIVSCVNACAGMSDPAQEIERLREKAAQRLRVVEFFKRRGKA